MSKIEVNTIDVQCGSTLTVGSSGKTVSLASGASQTGFGRTGTVDWCTTAKTGPFTAVSGDGFFVNTTSGAITITLPSSPSQGDIVAFKDYANTWATACKEVTLNRNGSKINGQCEDATLKTKSQSVTLIYVDGTKGWQDIHDSTANVTGGSFVAATGGTVITCGDFKTHVFTSTSTFVVSDAGSATIVVSDNSVSLSADGYIGGVQMTLSHDNGFEIDLTDNAMVAEYKTTGTSTTLVVVEPNDELLFTTSKSFDIVEMIVANSTEEIDVNMVSEFGLSTAYPNPFNPSTTVSLTVPSAD